MADISGLLKAIGAGDREAFDTLVREESHRLHAVAFHITGDGAIAEDVVQEAFLRIFQGRSPFREEGSGQGWITRIVARIALDTVRRREARRRHQERFAMDFDEEAEPPVAGLLRGEDARTLAEGLQNLSAETRAAIWLHVVEGGGLREVAESLGSTRTTVHRRIRMGLDQLRLFLERRNFAVHLTVPLGRLLFQLPVPPPSDGFLAELERLAPGRPGRRGRGTPAGPEGPKTDAADVPAAAALGRLARTLRGHPLLASAALLALLGSLGLSFWLFGVFDGRREPAVVVRPAEFPPAARVRATPPEPEPDRPAEPAAEPAPALVIEGWVVGEDGLPVEGAEVKAFKDLARVEAQEVLDRWGFVDLLMDVVNGIPPLASAASDGEGHFSLAFPEMASDLLLQALWTGQGSPRGGAVRVSAEEDREEVEIEVEPWEEISGVVRDGQGPLPGARVLAVPDPVPPHDRDFTSNDFMRILEGFMHATAVTDGGGRFRLPHPRGDEIGALLLVAIRDGYAAGYARCKEPPEANELRLLPAAPILGRTVIVPGDLSAPDVRIVLRSPEEDGTGWFAAAVSDSSGNFSLQGSTARNFEAFAKLAGFVRPEKISWQDGDTLPLRVEFGGGKQVQGQVRLASTGQPMEGIRVICRDRDGALVSGQAVSDGEGRYLLRGIPADSRCDFFVLMPGYVPRFTEMKEGVTDFDLVPTATVRGRVVGPDGAGVPGAWVEVISIADSDQEGIYLRWRKELLSQEHIETDAGGSYVAEDVVPLGKVILWAYHPELGENFVGPIEFSKDEPPNTELNVVLAGAGLEVLVSQTNGRPIGGVIVQLNAERLWDLMPKELNLLQWYTQRTTIDLSWYQRQLSIIPGARSVLMGGIGPCEWHDLMAGGYLVSISFQVSKEDVSNFYQDYWVYLGSLDQPLEPRQTRTLRLVLDPERKLMGKVVDPHGKGLSGLRVQVWYFMDIPGIKKGYGYSVIHSGEDGNFEAGALGPGPYRVTAGDVEDHLVEVKNVPEGAPDFRIVWQKQKNPETKE
jgi:RNA polymerase sigma-70 factor (ECF subfamily)